MSFLFGVGFVTKFSLGFFSVLFLRGRWKIQNPDKKEQGRNPKPDMKEQGRIFQVLSFYTYGVFYTIPWKILTA